MGFRKEEPAVEERQMRREHDVSGAQGAVFCQNVAPVAAADVFDVRLFDLNAPHRTQRD
jgi:hypothetical protein